MLSNSSFSLENIPFGIVSVNGQPGHVATRIGDYVISLVTLANKGAFSDCTIHGSATDIFLKPFLNEFMSKGRPVWREVRHAIQKFFANNSPESVGVPFTSVEMLLPCQIGDYTDFYASKEHATNVGVMFRGKDNALMPNWYIMCLLSLGYIYLLVIMDDLPR